MPSRASELKRYTEAEQMHRKSLDWRRKGAFVPGIAAELYNIANLCYYRQSFDEAEALFEESTEYYEKLQDHAQLAVVSDMLARSAARRKDWLSARDLAAKSAYEYGLAGNAMNESISRKWHEEIVQYLKALENKSDPEDSNPIVQ